MFKIICRRCGWFGFSRRNSVSGKKCPECQQATLTAEPYQHTATRAEPS